MRRDEPLRKVYSGTHARAPPPDEHVPMASLFMVLYSAGVRCLVESGSGLLGWGARRDLASRDARRRLAVAHGEILHTGEFET